MMWWLGTVSAPKPQILMTRGLTDPQKRMKHFDSQTHQILGGLIFETSRPFTTMIVIDSRPCTLIEKRDQVHDRLNDRPHSQYSAVDRSVGIDSDPLESILEGEGLTTLELIRVRRNVKNLVGPSAYAKVDARTCIRHAYFTSSFANLQACPCKMFCTTHSHQQILDRIRMSQW